MHRLITAALWLLIPGAVVLYLFFSLVASIGPVTLAPVVAVLGALTLVFALRSLRVGREMRDRGGDPRVRLEYNRSRERRGF